MTLLKRIRVLAAKIETTPGTDASLAAADGAFNAYDVMFQPSVEVESREAQGAFAKLAGVPGPYKGTATFKTDIAWDGTVTMPTFATILFAACGWVESSQVFTPRSEAPGTNVKTLTLGCYENGKLKKLVGAVGSFKIFCPAGKMAYIEWSFEGVWVTPTDTAIIAPTYPTANAIKFSSAILTYASVAMKVAEATFDAGNEIYIQEDPSTVSGLISGIIVDRSPVVTANPEAVLVATQAREQNLLDGTEGAISCVLDGPSSSTITIAAPMAQITNIQEGDRGKMVTDELEFSCNKNGTSNNEELSITFTETI